MPVKTFWASTAGSGGDRSALRKLDKAVKKMGDVLIKSIKDTKYDDETSVLLENDSGIARVVIFEKRKKNK